MIRFIDSLFDRIDLTSNGISIVVQEFESMSMSSLFFQQFFNCSIK